MIFSRIGAAALFFQTAFGMALSTGSGSEASCACAAAGTVSVTYVVIEMPPQTTTSTSTSTASATTTLTSATKVAETAAAVQAAAVAVASAAAVAANTTTTLGPISAPGIDCSNPDNIVPSSNVSLWYGTNATTSGGSINMTLALNHSTVVLEYIDAITSVDCSEDSLAVTFNSSASFDAAFAAWSAESALIMITNHLGDCDAEFERGFFKVQSMTSSADTNTITCASTKEELPAIGSMLPDSTI
jgi:hypothetical protein